MYTAWAENNCGSLGRQIVMICVQCVVTDLRVCCYCYTSPADLCNDTTHKPRQFKSQIKASIARCQAHIRAVSVPRWHPQCLLISLLYNTSITLTWNVLCDRTARKDSDMPCTHDLEQALKVNVRRRTLSRMHCRACQFATVSVTLYYFVRLNTQDGVLHLQAPSAHFALHSGTARL